MTAASCIGIDIGGTSIRFALVADDGRILCRHREPTCHDRGWEGLLGVILAGIRQVAADAAPRAIGLGVPGLIGADGTVHDSINIRPLEGRNIVTSVAAATGLPVTAVNDANAIAFGERTYGAGAPFGTFLMLTIGTGVGSGLVLNGRLWSGSDGFAAEYGHGTVEPEGLPCGCGNRGCLEQYASARAMARAAQRRMAAGEASTLSAVSADDLTAELVAEAARAGDPLAVSVLADAGRALGIALASAVNFLNPEAIIVGGGGAGSFDLLVPHLRREIDTRAFPLMAARVAICRGSLGDDAGLLGSAALARDLTD